MKYSVERTKTVSRVQR